MRLPRAPLEDWLRDYYFTTSADISCSGTEAFSFGELRELLGIDVSDLDCIVFRDSASLGMPALRSAIAQRWGDGDPSRVMATNGSSEALFLVMTALLAPDDEIVAIEPAYHSLVSIADGIGCRIVPWSLEFERGFEPDLDRLRSLLTPATRMLVVNFPHNPTGITVDAHTQRAIIELAENHGCYVVWDSVFADLTYDAPPLPDASQLGEQVITFGSLSKSYGLPGLRVGWCFGPPEVLAQCMVLRDYTTLALSPLIELVALRAVEAGDRLLHPRITQARRNLDLLSGWVLQNEGRVEWVRPRGGVTAFPRFPDVMDMNGFCHRLMHEHGTLLVPGTCFDRPQHVRLGFGGPTEELQRGLSAVSQLLASISPARQGRT